MQSSRRKFNFVATTQPPAPTKRVQCRPLNMLVDKKANCLSGDNKPLREAYLLTHISICYEIKLQSQRLYTGLGASWSLSLSLSLSPFRPPSKLKFTRSYYFLRYSQRRRRHGSTSTSSGTRHSVIGSLLWFRDDLQLESLWLVCI